MSNGFNYTGLLNCFNSKINNCAKALNVSTSLCSY